MEHYRRGQWDANLIEKALYDAEYHNEASYWLDYLDVCQAISGVTLHDWQHTMAFSQTFRTASPKLWMRLANLILNSKQLPGLSDAERKEQFECLLHQSTITPLAMMKDAFRSGYLGTQLSHYPALMTQTLVNKETFWQNRILTGKTASLAKLLNTSTIALQNLLSQSTFTNMPSLEVHKQAVIAVVGNSPNILQENRGEEIDAADIVVRFNTVHITPTNYKHIGKRTDIWVMSPSIPVGRCPDDASCIVASGHYALTRPSFYWRSLATADRLISELPTTVWHSLVSQFQAPPSAGVLLVGALESIGLADAVRCYGFTRDPDDSVHLPNHHVDDAPKSERHNWTAEANWLNKRHF